MSGQTLHNSNVEKEYMRWLDIIGPADPYYSKFTIGLHEVLQAHFLLIDFFFDIGEGIGGVGPKNMNLLHSALSRQFVEFGGKPKWKDRIQICASLMYGLIKNHPFHDANKRTSFLTSILHLQKIGRTPIVSHKEFEDFTVDIAEYNLPSYSGFDEFVQAGSDAPVLFIAKYLKKSTRQIDLRSKQITYNELNAIISKRNMYLDHPNGNRIDVMRIDEVPGRDAFHHRIAKIGFHGWSREVCRKDVDIVREASRLDARHGYDSQSFFNGLEDPLSLIVPASVSNPRL
ncbi:MAG: type II toxin-antitoxin system death-on-curing family toxin [Sphingomonadales bacterium]|nr:type II toxin-antitoxin system death-on-curing family toxin [Sphingomonadales bacterium]